MHRARSPGDGWTVRLRGGKPFVTDGPFAETKEFVGAFDILECDARFGAIEVREFGSD